MNCKLSGSLGVASDFLGIESHRRACACKSTCLDGSSVSEGMSYFQVNESSHSDFWTVGATCSWIENLRNPGADVCERSAPPSEANDQ